MKSENIFNAKVNSDRNLNFSLVKTINIDKLLARPYVFLFCDSITQKQGGSKLPPNRGLSLCYEPGCPPNGVG